MIKVSKLVVLFLISYLLLSQGSVRADIDANMIGVKKYQKFEYLQTKFIGSHPFFPFEEESYFSFTSGFLSREDHIFSIKIKDITTYDANYSLLDCEYKRDEHEPTGVDCSLDEILRYSPFVYIDWEYWGKYLEEVSFDLNSTTSQIEIINNENIFGYTWDYSWFDPSNNSNYENQLMTAVYDKKVGNIINFSRNSTGSDQPIENAFAYEIVSASINYGIEDIDVDIVLFFGYLIILIILIYLIYRKIKKKLSSDKSLEIS